MQIDNVKIYADESAEISSIGKVATGASFGVDSSYAIFTNINKSVGKSLDYLIIVDFEREQEALVPKIQDFADELGIELIVVKTNAINFGINADVLYAQNYLGSVLALQRLIGTYYYGSAYDDFKFDHEPAHFDLLSVECFSNGTTRFLSSNQAIDRPHKTEYLTKIPFTYSHLSVCADDDRKQCGRCTKCVRTQIDLDSAGCLDKYGDLFDINIYKTNRKKWLGRLMYWNGKEPFNTMSYRYAKEKGVKFPMRSYIWLGIYTLIYSIKIFFSIEQI